MTTIDRPRPATTAGRVPNPIRRHPLVAFAVLACGLSWLFVGATVAATAIVIGTRGRLGYTGDRMGVPSGHRAAGHRTSVDSAHGQR